MRRYLPYIQSNVAALQRPSIDWKLIAVRPRPRGSLFIKAISRAYILIGQDRVGLVQDFDQADRGPQMTEADGGRLDVRVPHVCWREQPDELHRLDPAQMIVAEIDADDKLLGPGDGAVRLPHQSAAIKLRDVFPARRTDADGRDFDPVRLRREICPVGLLAHQPGCEDPVHHPRPPALVALPNR